MVALQTRAGFCRALPARLVKLSSGVFLATLVLIAAVARPAEAANLGRFVFDVPSLPTDKLAQPAEASIPANPMLRLDIRTAGQTATDAAGQWRVDDEGKVARVWSIDSGKVSMVLRPPIGDGDVGEVRGVAMSPDGTLVALGWRSENAASIYVFDRATGRVVLRLDGLADVATRLAFSPDGQTIAASLASGGLQVFDLATKREIGRDLDYAGSAYSVAFSHDGRFIVTTSKDGLLRLYAAGGQSIRKLGSASASILGDPPVKAIFSPDGQRVAVISSMDEVDLFETSTMRHVSTVFGQALSGTPADVAWSMDGRYIYLAAYRGADWSTIYRWGQATTANPDLSFSTLSPRTGVDVTGKGFVSSLSVLPGGSIALATSAPAWGVVSEDGDISWKDASVGGRFSNHVINTGHPPLLLLSQDGMRVGFGYGPAGHAAAFDFAKLGLTNDETGLLPPITSEPGISISISGLLSTPKPPQLNGRQLPQSPGELSTSYAIAADGSHFVLGTIFKVRFYASNGQEIWEVPDSAYAVNISADGRWIVVDCSDGVLRWFRASDGRAMLSLRPDPDEQNWVAWTSAGYYASSPGSEDLIGWNVNRGLDRSADFFPASRFADVMRRPDIVTAVLRTAEDAAAVQTANSASERSDSVITPQAVASLLPPVLDLVSAPTRFASDSITIRYTVRTPPDAPMLGSPRVRVNGEWQPRSRAASQIGADGSRSLVVTGLPPRDSTVELFAENRHATSTALVVPLTWDGRAALSPGLQGAQAPRKPRLFLLAIGVSQYLRPDLKLNFADHDAQQFVAAMQAQQGKEYSLVTAKLLANQGATQAAVQDGLRWLQNQTGADDIAILFIAGHGFQTPDQQYFFAPSDFDPDRPRETGVKYTAIRDALVRFGGSGNRAVLLVDTCYAGGAIGSNLGASGGDAFAASLGRAEYSVVALTAANGSQLSYEDPSWGDGAFTKALLEAIVDAKADPEESGTITVLDLGRYVSKRVPVLTAQRQSPLLVMPSGGLADFPIAAR